MRFLSAVPLICALCSCSPAPVYRLESATEPFKWEQGVQVLERTDAGVTVRIGILNPQSMLLIFDLSVYNGTDSTLTVDPSQFHYRGFLEKPADSVSIVGKAPRITAVDPEQHIIKLQKEINEEKSSHAAALFGDAFMALVGIVADVATIGTPKTKEELDERERQENGRRARRAERDFYHSQRVSSLENEKARWENQTLRKTTLKPGESAGGLVYFPIMAKAQYIVLVISVAHSSSTFAFYLSVK